MEEWHGFADAPTDEPRRRSQRPVLVGRSPGLAGSPVGTGASPLHRDGRKLAPCPRHVHLGDRPALEDTLQLSHLGVGFRHVHAEAHGGTMGANLALIGAMYPTGYSASYSTGSPLSRSRYPASPGIP